MPGPFDDLIPSGAAANPFADLIPGAQFIPGTRMPPPPPPGSPGVSRGMPKVKILPPTKGWINGQWVQPGFGDTYQDISGQLQTYQPHNVEHAINRQAADARAQRTLDNGQNFVEQAIPNSVSWLYKNQPFGRLEGMFTDGDYSNDPIYGAIMAAARGINPLSLPGLGVKALQDPVGVGGSMLQGLGDSIENIGDLRPGVTMEQRGEGLANLLMLALGARNLASRGLGAFHELNNRSGSTAIFREPEADGLSNDIISHDQPTEQPTENRATTLARVRQQFEPGSLRNRQVAGSDGGEYGETIPSPYIRRSQTSAGRGLVGANQVEATAVWDPHPNLRDQLNAVGVSAPTFVEIHPRDAAVFGALVDDG